VLVLRDSRCDMDACRYGRAVLDSDKHPCRRPRVGLRPVGVALEGQCRLVGEGGVAARLCADLPWRGADASGLRAGNAGPSVDIYFHSGVWVSFNINRSTAGCVISPDEARAAYLKLAGLTQEVVSRCVVCPEGD
jgi:hypothetical protein